MIVLERSDCGSGMVRHGVDRLRVSQGRGADRHHRMKPTTDTGGKGAGALVRCHPSRPAGQIGQRIAKGIRTRGEAPRDPETTDSCFRVVFLLPTPTSHADQTDET
jgi:hypothetical protein